ncbi:type IV secretion system protein TrbI [Acidiphilium sp. MT5]
MRLRSSRPPVTRLSRRVLLALSAITAIGIGAALFFALQPHHRHEMGDKVNFSTPAAPDSLSVLPKSYANLPHHAPRLGPPLPGDLGPPIVHAGVAAPNISAVALPAANTANSGAKNRQLVQEREAARKSRLFVPTDAAQAKTSLANRNFSGGAASLSTARVSGATGANNSANASFAAHNSSESPVSAERLMPPASADILQAGSVIPAALLTGIRSDLPGLVTAQVTENVYDSPTGTILLIPQGARLIGAYNSQIAFGQSRVQLVWTRLIMPDGASILLDNQPAADPAGYAGLHDRVDNHWGMLFKAAILSTLLSVGTEVGTSTNNAFSLAQALRQGASQSINQVGEQVVGRSLGIQPTLTIRPGYPVSVTVTRDLVLAPYRG